MSSPATRSRANTRARLLDAAGTVFAEYGIAGTTVDQLVAEAGFTRGAFYSNFSSMYELAEEFFTTMLRKEVEAVRAAISAIPATEVSLDSLLDVMDSLGTGQELVGRFVLVRELELYAVRDERAAKVYTTYTAQLSTEIAGVIAEALSRLGRTIAIPPQELALLLYDMYVSASGRIIHHPEHLSPGQQIRPILDALLGGTTEEQ